VFRRFLTLFNRSSPADDRKEHVMPEPTESPGTAAAPGNAAPADVSRQIADLTDAVNRLVAAQSQYTQPTQTRDASSNIGGDIPGGGSAPRGAVDLTRLSPVQQIALGLRDVKPVGPGHPVRGQAVARNAPEETVPAGAD
jgi:hypothetical protein